MWSRNMSTIKRTENVLATLHEKRWPTKTVFVTVLERNKVSMEESLFLEFSI